MPRGKQTRALRPDQIARLAAFKAAPHREEGAPHGYSFPQLRSAMGASFRWDTLKKVLAGLPVWDLHHAYIVEWIERYLPPAAGDDSESDEEKAEADGTLPGKS
jgi:hypothetical protein